MTEPSSPEVSAAELREVGLFGALPDPVLEHLAAALHSLKLEVGELAFREGETADDMFVLLRGEMEVLKQSAHHFDARVALLGPGDWFGEMSILDVQPRSATVRAVAPSHLLRITAADLDKLYRSDLKSYALIVLNLSRELSRRLRVADGILSDLVANVVAGYQVKTS